MPVEGLQLWQRQALFQTNAFHHPHTSVPVSALEGTQTEGLPDSPMVTQPEMAEGQSKFRPLGPSATYTTMPQAHQVQLPDPLTYFKNIVGFPLSFSPSGRFLIRFQIYEKRWLSWPYFSVSEKRTA